MNMHVGSAEFSRIQDSNNRPSVNYEAMSDTASVFTASNSQGTTHAPMTFNPMVGGNSMQSFQMIMSMFPMILALKSMGLDTSAMFGGAAAKPADNKQADDVLKVQVKNGDTIERIVREQYKDEIACGANDAAKKRILAEKIVKVKEANKLSGNADLRIDKELVMPGLKAPEEDEEPSVAETSADKKEDKPNKYAVAEGGETLHNIVKKRLGITTEDVKLSDTEKADIKKEEERLQELNPNDVGKQVKNGTELDKITVAAGRNILFERKPEKTADAKQPEVAKPSDVAVKAEPEKNSDARLGAAFSEEDRLTAEKIRQAKLNGDKTVLQGNHAIVIKAEQDGTKIVKEYNSPEGGLLALEDRLDVQGRKATHIEYDSNGQVRTKYEMELLQRSDGLLRTTHKISDTESFVRDYNADGTPKGVMKRIVAIPLSAGGTRYVAYDPSGKKVAEVVKDISGKETTV